MEEVLKSFGAPKDRLIWMWYCRRIGISRFLDIFDRTVTEWEAHEIRYPVLAFQRRLMEAFPKGGVR